MIRMPLFESHWQEYAEGMECTMFEDLQLANWHSELHMYRGHQQTATGHIMVSRMNQVIRQG